MVSELDRAKRALVTLINLWLLSVLLLWKWCGILMMLLHAGPSEECLAKFTQTGVETKPTRNVSTRLTKYGVSLAGRRVHGAGLRSRSQTIGKFKAGRRVGTQP